MRIWIEQKLVRERDDKSLDMLFERAYEDGTFEWWGIAQLIVAVGTAPNGETLKRQIPTAFKIEAKSRAEAFENTAASWEAQKEGAMAQLRARMDSRPKVAAASELEAQAILGKLPLQ